MELEFFRRISKNTQVQNFVNIRLVRAKLSHADRQTGIHDEANSIFSKFSESA